MHYLLSSLQINRENQQVLQVCEHTIGLMQIINVRGARTLDTTKQSINMFFARMSLLIAH